MYKKEKKEGIHQKERIRKRSEFNQVFRSARRIETSEIRIYCSENKMEISRFAVVTSRKLGNAVIRNRIKRILKEIYRRNRKCFGKGMDWIFIPKKTWDKIDYFHSKRMILDAISGIKRDKRFFKT